MIRNSATMLVLAILPACKLFTCAPTPVEAPENCPVEIVVEGWATLDLTESGTSPRWTGGEEHDVFQQTEDGGELQYQLTDSFDLEGDVVLPTHDLADADWLELDLISTWTGSTQDDLLDTPDAGSLSFEYYRVAGTILTSRGTGDEEHVLDVSNVSEQATDDGVVLELTYSEVYFQAEDGSSCSDESSDSVDETNPDGGDDVFDSDSTPGGCDGAPALEMPVPVGLSYRMSQGVGGAFSHYYTSTATAVDIAVPLYDTVVAPASGELYHVPSAVYGEYQVIIALDTGEWVRIGHMSSIADTFHSAEGAAVRMGTPIGSSGDLGVGDGVHVHMTVCSGERDTWVGGGVSVHYQLRAIDRGTSGTEEGEAEWFCTSEGDLDDDVISPTGDYQNWHFFESLNDG